MNSAPTQNLAEVLKNTIPKIKTHIQLSAFVVTVVIVLLIRNFSPDNTPAQVAGGMIGISIIIFTLIFNRLDLFPTKERGHIILTLFGILSVVVIILVGLTGYFLMRDDKRVYHSLYDQIRSRLEKRETDLRADLLDKTAQRNRAATADKFDEWTEIGTALEGLRTELQAVQTRRKSLDNSDTRADAIVKEVERIKHEATARDSQSITNLARRADEALRQGDTKAAEELFSAMATSGFEQAANAQFWSGRVAELEADYRGALEKYLSAYKLEPTNSRYITAVGEAYETLGNLKEAKIYYTQLINTLRGNPAKRVELVLALSSVANVRRFLDENDAARRLYEEALDVIDNATNDHDKVVKASVANDFAAFYVSRGDYVNGEKYYNMSLSIYNEIGGSADYGFSDVLNNLGQLYALMGRFPKAIDLLNKALLLEKDAMGTDTEPYAVSTRNMGLAYLGWGDLVAADARFERALGIIDRVLGKETTAYARTEGMFAECLLSEGDVNRADEEAKDSLAQLEVNMGPDNTLTGLAHLRVGEIESRKGSIDSAHTHLEAAAEILKKSSDNMVVQTHLHWAQARYLADSGNIDQANLEYDAVLSDVKTLFGVDYPDFVKILSERCELQEKRENLETARGCYAEARQIAMKLFLPTHPLFVELNKKAVQFTL